MARPQDKNTRLMAYIVIFLAVVGLSFLGVLWFAKTYYPREREDTFLMQMSGQQQEARPFWKRFFSMDRDRPSRARRQSNSRSDDETAVGRGGGGAGHNLSPQHLALRELMEAQVILHSQSSVPQREVLETIRATPIQGPFRTFEEKRFATRMLLITYLEQTRDPQVLAELHQLSLEIAPMPEASFEEFFYAGVSSLLAGEPKTAEKWLVKAEETWPARGRNYGNIYLFLMIARGINGQQAEAMQMLDNFQETFPDWLYIETFMPDLDDLEQVYPKSGILKVVKGHAYSLVFNQSAALDAYKAAIATGDLDWKTSRQVAEWIQTIEAGQDG